MSAEDRRGLSPSDQILKSKRKEKLIKVKESGALKGKPFIFDHSHAAYEPSTGLIEIIRSKGAEKEIERGLVETKFGPAGHMDLPTAIAHVYHVVDDYELAGGVVTEEDRAVLDNAYRVLEWWSQTPISEENRRLKEEEVAEFLGSTKYASSRDRKRKEISKDLQRGTHRDSIGRINPEAMKTIVAVAIKAGEAREDRNRIIFIKYGLQLLPDLVIERGEEKRRLRAARMRIDQVLRVEERYHKTYEKKVRTLVRDLPGILNPGVVRLAPFNRPSAEILAALVPVLFADKEKGLKRILGVDNFWEIRKNETKKLADAIRALNVAPRDARGAIDTLLTKASEKLNAVVEEEQAKMDEEMEKRRIRLANRPQAIV